MLSNVPNLIQLVFADPKDTYYSDDLLALDFSQYLWMRMHREGYRTVYFLSQSKSPLTGSSFLVRTFGDRERKTVRGGLFGLKQLSSLTAKNFVQNLSAWLKEAAAVICPLHEFCSVLEEPEWQNVFQRRVPWEADCQGTVVLTASIYAENNEADLLSSSVFEENRLDFSPILQLRRATRQGLYEGLEQKMQGGYTALFVPTAQRLMPILTRVLLEHPERIGAGPDPERLAGTLERYLRAPGRKDQANLKEFTGLGVPFRHLSYRKIYDGLCDADTWNGLVAQSRLEQEQTAAAEPIPPFPLILRVPNGYAERCLVLAMPRAEGADPRLLEEIKAHLEHIRAEVASPKNRIENKKLQEEIGLFLAEASGARNKQDLETYCRVVYAIDFCLQWLDVQETDEPFGPLCSMLATMKQWTALSGQFFESRRKADRWEGMSSGWYQKSAEAAKRELVLSQKALALYDEKIPLIAEDLSLQNAVDKIESLTRDLEDKLTEIRELSGSEGQPEPAVQPELQEKGEDGAYDYHHLRSIPRDIF